MPYLLIDQPAGIGDIMYCSMIGEIYGNHGYEVYWPVTDQFLWIKDRFNIVHTRFCSFSDDFPLAEYFGDRSIVDPLSVNGNLYLPLRASTLSHVSNTYPLMWSKYKMAQLEHHARKWHFAFNVKRLKDSEQLVQSHYDLADEEYIFTNSVIGSAGYESMLQPMVETLDSLQRSGLRVIQNVFIEGTNILDMAQIIANAAEIHIPCSGLAWLAEYLRVRGYSRPDQKRYVYPRDRLNPINDNWNYMQQCWDESEWTFVQP
jgi:hypothetical protein